jgi:hypothetical protein
VLDKPAHGLGAADVVQLCPFIDPINQFSRKPDAHHRVPSSGCRTARSWVGLGCARRRVVLDHFPAFAFSPSSTSRPGLKAPACFPQRQTSGMYNGSVGPIAECIPLLQHGRSSLTFSLRVVENSVVIKRSNRPYHDENVYICGSDRVISASP